VVKALLRIRNDWIKNPTKEEMRTTSFRFYEKFGIPNILTAATSDFRNALEKFLSDSGLISTFVGKSFIL